MSVYNGADYVRESVESILNQTVNDFEFLIVDDGSTDDSFIILKSFTDPRITLFAHDVNKGLSKSLNELVQLATGQYVARQDADDISVPDRFETQLEFLSENPNIDICGSWLEEVPGGHLHKFPQKDDQIKCRFFVGNALAHPTIMFRAGISNLIHYNEQIQYSQDYELWARIMEKVYFGNIPKPLVNYRKHSFQTSQNSQHEQTEIADRIRLTLLGKLITASTHKEQQNHLQLVKKNWRPDKRHSARLMFKWIDLIEASNDRKSVFPKRLFNVLLDYYRLFILRSFGLRAMFSFDTLSISSGILVRKVIRKL